MPDATYVLEDVTPSMMDRLHRSCFDGVLKSAARMHPRELEVLRVCPTRSTFDFMYAWELLRLPQDLFSGLVPDQPFGLLVNPLRKSRHHLSWKKTMSTQSPQSAVDIDDLAVMLAEIWKEVLGVDPSDTIDPEADFFEIGGTSLSMITVIAILSRRVKRSLPTAVVVNGSTINALAESCFAELSRADPA